MKFLKHTYMRHQNKKADGSASAVYVGAMYQNVHPLHEACNPVSTAYF